MGRVVSISHYDKTYDEFKYNKNGALIDEAKNQDATANQTAADRVADVQNSERERLDERNDNPCRVN